MKRVDRRSRFFFSFQAEAGIRDPLVTGVQTCALPLWGPSSDRGRLWTRVGPSDPSRDTSPQRALVPPKSKARISQVTIGSSLTVEPAQRAGCVRLSRDRDHGPVIIDVSGYFE